MDRRNPQRRSPVAAQPPAVDTGLIGEFAEIGTELRDELSELRDDMVEVGVDLRSEVVDIGREMRVEAVVLRARWQRALAIHFDAARRRRLAGLMLNVAIAAGLIVAGVMAFLA